MKLSIKLILGGLLALTGATIAVTVTATPAQAVSCSAAECYVDSTVRAESDWEETVIADSTSSGGSGEVSNNLLTAYHPCDTWLPQGGGTTVRNYPAVNSSSYGCDFSDGAASSSGQGYILFQCPPAGDRASNGRYSVYHLDPETGQQTYMYYYCVYPTDDYAPIERLMGSGKVYTGGIGTFVTTGLAVNSALTTHGSNGKVASTTGYINRSVDLNRPENYTGAWQPSFTAKTAKKANGDPVYGYYRLDWTLDYRICEKWAYPSWLGMPERNDCSQRGTDTSTNPYTYACNFNPALVSGVRTDGLFVPSQCEPRWECVMTGNTLVGGQRNNITAMRNGQNLPVVYPSLSLSGGNVRSPSNWRYLNAETTAATPALSYVKSSWKWGKWDTYNRTGTIAFNWATESKNKPFEWSTRYRFTAQFNLPTTSAVGKPTTHKWVTGEGECSQTTRSPKTDVVRAVNK